MGKAPAFQFYIKDWIMDVELQICSASTRGIWINALCYMWSAKERGKLTGDKESLRSLLKCSESEFELFLNEASVTKFADVTLCNNFVTLKNRRMYNEEKTREKTRLRVQKHRRNAKSNADVTPPSSSSSSSPTAFKNESSNEDSPPSRKNHGSTEKVNFNFETREWENIKPADFKTWSAAYPAVDVNGELAKAAAWLLADPKRKKVQYKRFLNNWFSRAQDRGPRKGVDNPKRVTAGDW